MVFLQCIIAFSSCVCVCVCLRAVWFILGTQVKLDDTSNSNVDQDKLLFFLCHMLSAAQVLFTLSGGISTANGLKWCGILKSMRCVKCLCISHITYSYLRLLLQLNIMLLQMNKSLHCFIYLFFTLHFYLINSI